MPLLEQANKTVEIAGQRLRVDRVAIMGTDIMKYEVWEHTGPEQRHSTTIMLEGSPVRWGRVGTRVLPAHIQKMNPGSHERLLAVDNFHVVQFELAYSAIRKAFPDSKDGDYTSGKIYVSALPRH